MTIFVPRPVLTFVVGVSGHRPRRLGDTDQIKLRLADVFSKISDICLSEYETVDGCYASNAGGDPAKEPYRVRLLTGFAEGADQLAAEVAPSAWEVEAILAGDRTAYEGAFLPRQSSDGTDKREEFRYALTRAEHRIIELPETTARFVRGSVASPESIQAARQAGYARQGQFMIRQIDLLVAVWDGEPDDQAGSTFDVVMSSLKSGVPVLWLSATQDRAPWLLLRPEDVDRETEAPNALVEAGALQDVMTQILRPPPPGDARPGAQGPRERLKQFLDQKERKSCWWFAYDCLKYGTSFWTRPFPIPLHDRAAVEAQWRPFLERAPEGGDFRDRVKSVLLPRYHAADQIATYYSHAYRSAYVLAYFLSSLAVLLTLAGTLPPFPHEPPVGLWYKGGMVLLELLVIGAIIAIVRRGRRGDWHGRWLDARALAERLRHARFLGLMGCWPDTARADGDVSSNGVAWTSWYLRATIRELGLPFKSLDAAYQRNALLATQKFELEEQLKFNAGNHERLSELDHWLHRLGGFSFFATFFVLAAFVLGVALFVLNPIAVEASPGRCQPEGSLPCILDALKPYVVLIAAVLPAFGAAMAGVRFTGDFKEFAERSWETAARLRKLQEAYKLALERDEFELTAATLSSTASIMEDDLSGWQSLYARKVLTLPG